MRISCTPEQDQVYYSISSLEALHFRRHSLLRSTLQVANPLSGGPLQIRIGIHSGGVNSGIVGKIRARYCERHGIPSLC